MGTKRNPGEFDCHGKAEMDEPLFTLLARDPLAPILVSLWAELRRTMAPEDVRKVLEAKRCAIDMMRWRTQNPDKARNVTANGIASPAETGEATQTPRSDREATTERSDPSAQNDPPEA